MDVKPTVNEVIEEGQLILGYFPNCSNLDSMKRFLASRIDDVDVEVHLEVGDVNYNGGADPSKAELVKQALHKAVIYLTLGRLWQTIKNVMVGYDAESLPPEYVDPSEAAENREFYLSEGRAIIEKFDVTMDDPGMVAPYFNSRGVALKHTVLGDAVDKR